MPPTQTAELSEIDRKARYSAWVESRQNAYRSKIAGMTSEEIAEARAELSCILHDDLSKSTRIDLQIYYDMLRAASLDT